ncbi:MAG: hypothetical protein ACI4SL_02640 [Candidatus Ornithospirochaeta sp.]
MKSIDPTIKSPKETETIIEGKDENYKKEYTITRPNLWRIFAFSGRKEYDDDDDDDD